MNMARHLLIVALGALSLAPSVHADGNAAEYRAWMAKQQAAKENAARQASADREARQRRETEAEVKMYRHTLGGKATGKSDAEVLQMGQAQAAADAKLTQNVEQILGGRDPTTMSSAEQQDLMRKIQAAAKASGR